METSLYLENYTELYKSIIKTKISDGELQQSICNYLTLPRSINSVRLLNTDYRTIEYDNIDEFSKKIEESNSSSFYKNSFHFINKLINHNKIFYVVACNKPTWVRFNKEFVINNDFQHPFTIEPLKYTYYTYYLLKVYRGCINNMIIGIDYIYSEQCKNAQIKKHPNYKKGRDYFITAADAAMTMINELILMNTFIIKSETTFANESSTAIAINSTSTKELLTFYHSLVNIDANNKQVYDSQDIDTKKKTFAYNNKKLYFGILSILTPCNFNNLCNRLWIYHLLLKNNIYLYQVINEVPNPEYLGHYLKINCQIETI